MTELPPASLGHNMPPPAMQIILEENAEIIRTAELAALTAEELCRTRAIETDADMEPFLRAVKNLRDAGASLEIIREASVRPHLDAQREINNGIKALVKPLDDWKREATRKMDAYQNAKILAARAEAQRLQQEAEKERQRQIEIAERAAEAGRTAAAAQAQGRAGLADMRANLASKENAASAADIARVTTVHGTATVSMVMDFEIIDIKAIDLSVLRPFIPRADIEKYIRAYLRVAKKDAECPGVRFFETAATRVR